MNNELSEQIKNLKSLIVLYSKQQPEKAKLFLKTLKQLENTLYEKQQMSTDVFKNIKDNETVEMQISLFNLIRTLSLTINFLSERLEEKIFVIYQQEIENGQLVNQLKFVVLDDSLLFLEYTINLENFTPIFKTTTFLEDAFFCFSFKPKNLLKYLNVIKQSTKKDILIKLILSNKELIVEDPEGKFYTVSNNCDIMPSISHESAFINKIISIETKLDYFLSIYDFFNKNDIYSFGKYDKWKEGSQFVFFSNGAKNISPHHSTFLNFDYSKIKINVLNKDIEKEYLDKNKIAIHFNVFKILKKLKTDMKNINNTTINFYTDKNNNLSYEFLLEEILENKSKQIIKIKKFDILNETFKYFANHVTIANKDLENTILVGSNIMLTINYDFLISTITKIKYNSLLFGRNNENKLLMLFFNYADAGKTDMKYLLKTVDNFKLYNIVDDNFNKFTTFFVRKEYLESMNKVIPENLKREILFYKKTSNYPTILTNTGDKYTVFFYMDFNFQEATKYTNADFLKNLGFIL